jgi:hypothetical protein
VNRLTRSTHTKNGGVSAKNKFLLFNLVALAVTASYARNEDLAFSDLELTAFVRKMPDGKHSDGFGKIRDALLIEVIWTTEDLQAMEKLTKIVFREFEEIFESLGLELYDSDIAPN